MRRLTLTALMWGLGLVSTLALAAPGMASGVKATCVVDGDVKVQDKLDPQYGVRLVGGKGFYTFDGQAICTGVSKGAPTATILQLRSTGTYENVVCGTGKAQGTDIRVVAASDGQVAKWNALISDEKYAVDFLLLAGEFWWHDTAKNKIDLKADLFGSDPDKDGVEDEKDYDFGGLVQLSLLPLEKPPLVASPPGNCVKAFHVTGEIVVDE